MGIILIWEILSFGIYSHLRIIIIWKLFPSGKYSYLRIIPIWEWSLFCYDANSEIINLYPNPNNGQFAIELLVPLQNPKSEIIISDLGGKQIFHGPLSSEETTKQFDLSNVKSGIYIMTIANTAILVTKKIIIK